MTDHSSKFPYPHYADHKSKTVYVHIASGYPATLAVPILVKQYYPDYRGSLCSMAFINSLQNNEQKESN